MALKAGSGTRVQAAGGFSTMPRVATRLESGRLVLHGCGAKGREVRGPRELKSASGSLVLSALISQVSDLVQLVKELYADNQHLKKTIFDLSCLGFQGDGRLESTEQTEVSKTLLLSSCANYQK